MLTRAAAREMGRWMGHLVLGLMAAATVVQLARIFLALGHLSAG